MSGSPTSNKKFGIVITMVVCSCQVRNLTHREDVALASVLSVFLRLFPKFKSSRILSAE